ncbi:hypothetical protein QBC36DRAFT_146500, partial [Triangularia setosa]
APKPRFPIIIGSENILKTVEELGAIFNMPEMAPVDLDALDDESLHLGKTTISHSGERQCLSCDVCLSHCLDLRDCTQGEHITVWFQDKLRDAWL